MVIHCNGRTKMETLILLMKNEAKNVISKVKGQKGKIIEVAQSDKKKYSPALYDLTELQRDGNKFLDFLQSKLCL